MLRYGFVINASWLDVEEGDLLIRLYLVESLTTDLEHRSILSLPSIFQS